MTTGIVLIAIGIILFIIEATDPGFFIAIPAGVLITLGFMFIFFPGQVLSIWTPLVVAAVVLPLMFISLKFYQNISPPSKPTTTMTTSLEGETAQVVKEIEPNNISGKVKVSGSKIWSATADEKIEVGEKVKIVKAEGVKLVVERLEEL
ncbi:MAG: NfeD family protein [Candidatus Thermoplasmatota archaeon]|nr:NfeD family protein [Candidatus Thermoplasmatota archaeon]